MVLVLLIHLACIYSAEHFADESFYPATPLRLINGDSLISDDWHVTQFSSLFLYLPVRFWLAVKGSTEGIILFLRYFYLVIHTAVSVVIYTFFRKHRYWAIGAALIFYTQVPLRFLSANYHSLLALFLLFFTISLYVIYKKENNLAYVLAGFFYGCCCVCNPFECFVFVIYAIACIIWYFNTKKYEKLNKYFNKKAFLKFSSGLCIAAFICIIFFFATGGTIDGVLTNIPNLLTDGSHDIFLSPLEAFRNKFLLTVEHFNTISFNLPFLLPLFYTILLVDKKRRKTSHCLLYLTLSLLLGIFYMVGVFVSSLSSSRCLAMSLPFAIISTTCYILTQNKNKPLFYCMWLPGLIANFIQYLASDLHLSTLWVLTISNIAGVFFLKDFINEFKADRVKGEQSVKSNSNKHHYCRNLICFGLCIQLLFQGLIYCAGKTINVKEYIKLEKGPYAGLMLEEENYNKNIDIMKDLDTIKLRTSPDDPVLIISEFTWMYLYIDRPFATYSPWQPYPESKRLRIYYAKHPEKTPKYIYVCWYFIPTGVSSGHKVDKAIAKDYADGLARMLSCEYEELSSGFLLKVLGDIYGVVIDV